LYIDGNIHYTGTCLKTQLCTVRDIASLAFIVLNGNIYVDKDVTEMSGVFFVQEGTTDGTGRIFSNDGTSTDESASYEKLTVYGSIYGDIDPLFNKRFFAGDPANEDGGIVIRFDERVILNTPPALRDVLNLSQTQVAR
ncbi:hypothetical protein KJ835_02560, partial [Patescibacteria group bacterium]|nr:hypothetical protein [Patescibacteria group bacterium]